MNDPLIDKANEQLRRYKELSVRRDQLEKDRFQLSVLHAERKKILKGRMDECKAAGLDPNSLREDVQRLTDVIKVKLDTWSKEIEAGETMIKPLLSELKE